MSDLREGRDWEKEEFTFVRLLGVGCWWCKNTCFANSSYYVQLNKLSGSLVPDKKRSVRKPWICSVPLQHTHVYTFAAFSLHFVV